VILAVFALLVLIFVILPLAGMALWLVISTAALGIVFGALGRLIVPGHQPIGVLATICCGLVGSLLGGAVSQAAHLPHVATLLVEVAVAASAVALWSATHRQSIQRGRRSRGIIDV
jgi:uncharacterized membrane protein YeaQ/YmgE (transglycosylase-associated protein family)